VAEIETKRLLAHVDAQGATDTRRVAHTKSVVGGFRAVAQLLRAKGGRAYNTNPQAYGEGHRHLDMQGLRFCFLFTGLAALLCAANATAYSLEAVEVEHNGDTYVIGFAVTLEADAIEVGKVLADYAMWPRLSDNVMASQLVDTRPSGAQRIAVTFHACVLAGLICRSLRQLKDLEQLPDGRTFVSSFVPRQPDFASGFERWQLRPLPDGTTRLRYDSSFVLAFRLPPLIGPWLMKRELRREIVASAAKLERLVADHHGAAEPPPKTTP